MAGPATTHTKEKETMSEPSYPLCITETCGRPMRPRGYTAEMAPGTVAMGHGGCCKSCVQPKPRRKSSTPPIKLRKPPGTIDARTAHTISGLQSFYAMRYARGVKPEGLATIKEIAGLPVSPAQITGPAIIHIPAPKTKGKTKP